jgi:hypothetical protein
LEPRNAGLREPVFGVWTTTHWFRISIVRQFLDRFEETNVVSREDTAAWIRANLSRIEALFAEDAPADSCQKISALEKAMADKYYGPAQLSN